MTPLSRTFLAGLILVSNALAGSEPIPLTPDWATGSVWDDGLAEVAVYEANRTIYGESRPYEAVLLTVKEDLDGRSLVKADPPYGDREIVTVLKLNAVRQIATPNYDYRMMTSVFVVRGDPSRWVKATSGSHEWCGNTWKAVRRRGARTTYDWSSYFDGEADGIQNLDVGERDLLEDQLPLVLRGLQFREGLRFEARLFPTLATTHAGPARWIDVTVRVSRGERLELPAGRFETWRVEIDGDGHRSRWWLDAAGNHALVKMEKDGGDRMRLQSIRRRAYWVLP